MAEARGYNISYNGTYPKNTTNLTARITEIRDLGADILIGGTYFSDSVLIVETCRALNYTPDAIFTTIGPSDEQFGVSLGNDSLYVWSGVHFHKDLPLARNWTDSYHDAYGSWPDYHAAGGYSICQVLGMAVGSTGSLNNSILADHIRSNTFQTVIGDLDFGADGVPDYGMVTIQWQMVGGTPQSVIVYPTASATVAPVFPMPA